MRVDQVPRRLGPAAAVDAIWAAARAVSPRVLRALARPSLARRAERRLPLDAGAAAAARRVVAEACGGRVAVPVVERAQLAVAELVGHGLSHGGGSGREVTVRVGLRPGGCRVEVRMPAGVQPPHGLADVAMVSERWGLERGADGATRAWAELFDRDGSRRALEQASVRAGVTTARSSDAADVHVVPIERAATWAVYDARAARPVSEHATETEAEKAARLCARDRGRRRVVIHDRYHRIRETTLKTGAGDD